MNDPHAQRGSIARIYLLGVPMDCVTMKGAVEFADQMITSGTAGAIYAINPEKIMAAREQPALMQALSDAKLLIPDGIGAVMAARLRGMPDIERVPGSELMPALCELARERGYGVYLFGGRPEVNQQTAERLAALYPGLDIAGRHHGYVDGSEQDALLEDINRSGAQILFVALGSPRQELWTSGVLPQLHTVRVCQGVGGTFDVFAGRVRRAPGTWQKLGLEWLYRVLHDPARLKRLPALARYAWAVMTEPRSPDAKGPLT